MFSFVKKYAGLFMLVCGLAGIVMVNIFSAAAKEASPVVTTISTVGILTTSATSTSDLKTKTSFSECYVDIKGEVKEPGVYIVLPGTRIYQVIELAGGLTSYGSTASLNLADTVTDGMVVYVPSIQSGTKSEDISLCVQIRGAVENPGIYYVSEGQTVADLVSLAGGLTEEADISSLDFERILSQGYSVIVPSYSQDVTDSDTNSGSDETPEGLVNINTANLDELMTLKGIGLILGQRIIDYRAENGDFACCEDIMLVSGIKDAIYEDIKDFITVGNG